jgi:transcriptional regulator with XRE-family HTH domain
MEVTFKNHVPELMKARGIDWKKFRREAYIKTGLTEPTLAKANRGETDLTIESVAKLAHFFGVTMDEVLEPKIK